MAHHSSIVFPLRALYQRVVSRQEGKEKALHGWKAGEGLHECLDRSGLAGWTQGNRWLMIASYPGAVGSGGWSLCFCEIHNGFHITFLLT